MFCSGKIIFALSIYCFLLSFLTHSFLFHFLSPPLFVSLARSSRPSRLEGYDNYPGGAWFSGQLEGSLKTPDRTPGRIAVEQPSSLARSALRPRTNNNNNNNNNNPNINALNNLNGNVGNMDEGALPSVSILDGVNVSFLNDSEDVQSRSSVAASTAAALAPSSFSTSTAGLNPAATDPCWVIIFGFPSSQTAQVIEEMLSCGQIVSFHADNPLSNWVHVQFETSLGAQRALTRDGSVLERLGGLMIGVRRSAGRDSKPRVVHSSTTAVTTQSLFLQQQHRSGLSVTSSQLAYGFAPYAINSWWSRFKFYVFGIN